MKNTLWKAANWNRTLWSWSMVQLVLSFCILIPFSLTPAVWGSLLAFAVVTSFLAAAVDQKVPRVCAKVLWVAAGILRWLLVAYVVYAAFVFAPEATAGYDADSRADIFAATLVPLLSLCVVTLPSQAFVARRSKADARRVVLLSAFSAVVAVLLYAYEAFAVKTVVLVADGLLGQLMGLLAAAVAVAVLAVAFRGLLQQKTASDNMSKADE